MDAMERVALLQANPERYATTGLDWGNPAHHEAIANGLFQTLMGHLARQQGAMGRPEGKVLRSQQARIEQRLSVVERALYRSGAHSPRRMEDQVVIYGLERMADALEEGARAWRRREERSGSNLLAGSMLGVAVGMASAVRGHGGLERFSIGPFGALSKIAALVTRPDVQIEMGDLPALGGLVQKGREIPSLHVVRHANESCGTFYEAFDGLLTKLQKRDREQEWGC